MTTAPRDPGAAGVPRNEGIRTLLAMASQGDGEQHLHIQDVLGGLAQGAFGMFLLLAILPAFIPLPGVAGALSGPLVMLIGAQMLVGLRSPWLPAPIARRGPRRRTLHRFVSKLQRPLTWLDSVLKPRLALTIEPLAARLFTGAQLILLGLLLSLPIPFTNYLFGFQLMLFALALLERDGRLMLLNWLGGVAAIAFFGISSGQLLTYLTRLANDLFN
ncbi:membrane protein [Stenotrophomonas ginsengisoli]|uniref:Membrane protein n=1 Tax=Stenotrophomonas ginsengisoli TaxID=336566 RepID=A0A0R0DJ90_9GAMM|nr:exopolysaccharide biosynthesis protein [Stenotrophomonas ginsengisoli]KRG77576.1 membrane protein [Stenotrophomonas ginsengisoli]